MDKNDNQENNWTNKRVDKFVVVNKEIGKGAFGVVYRGFFLEDDTKLVAVKSVNIKQIQNSTKWLELIKREISILQKVNSKYIVKLYDVARTSHYLYLFFEYCADGDLKQYLKKKEQNRLSENEAVLFLKHMTEAFRELHQKDIIHRDIKPANILLQGGIAKISDFGFARVVESGIDTAYYFSRLGSPLYMAPQILEGAKFSSKCDVWSTGIVFYEMLYGKTPWAGEDQYRLLKNIQTIPLKIPDIPVRSSQTKDLLRKMLQYSEEARFGWQEVLSHPVLQKASVEPIPQHIDASKTQDPQKQNDTKQTQLPTQSGQTTNKQSQQKQQEQQQLQQQKQSQQYQQQQQQQYQQHQLQQQQQQQQQQQPIYQQPMSQNKQPQTSNKEDIEDELIKTNNKYINHNLVAGYLQNQPEHNDSNSFTSTQDHQSLMSLDTPQSKQSQFNEKNDKDLELIISRHLGEEKIRKGILKVNQFIQLQRNIGFFFNQVIHKLLKAHGNQKLQIKVDLYFKLIFVLSKFQNISLNQVKNTLLEKSCEPFNTQLWQQYRDSQEYKSSFSLICSDINHSIELFKGITIRAKDIIQQQMITNYQVDKNKCNEFLLIMNDSFELTKEFKMQAKDTFNEFLNNYIDLVQNTINTTDKDIIIIIKYVLICRIAYIQFNVPEFDFSKFYEENENDLPIEQLKKDIMELHAKQKQLIQ